MRTWIFGLAFSLAAAACASSSAPSGDDNEPPDLTDVPQRSCATRFSLHPNGNPDHIYLTGQWDWTAREELTDPDRDGTFTLDKQLGTGTWAYKFVLSTNGVEDWIEDPVNQYRAYDSGVENSGVRVEDCSTPLVTTVSHQVTGTSASTKLTVQRGSSGAAIATLHAIRRFEGTETPVDVVQHDGDLTIDLSSLAVGKHTLVVDATASDGLAAPRILIPFWIEADPFDWRDASIYMVMTDRFRNGDPANDPGPSAGADPQADYFGGDLRGVTSAIDDGTFDDLGITTLWLSPFVANAQRVEYDGTHGVTAYHGYWPIKARAIDPRLGTEQDLDALVLSAHRHGIRILMDYVVNHVHQDHEYFAAHPEWFRTGCVCGTPGCDWTEMRLSCLFQPYLPDVNWTLTAVSDQMVDDAMWWLERFDLDGLRVDAVKHVEDLAIVNLSTRIHDRFELGGTDYFLLGETAMGWSGDNLTDNLPQYAMISHYIGDRALDGQFDFVLYQATASRVWTDDLDGMLHLDYWTRESQLNYPAGAIMSPFVGSHDTSRLLSRADYGSSADILLKRWSDETRAVAPVRDEPYDRAAIALTWTLTVPGAPLLYYGDEYGESGGNDPDNRHFWVPPTNRTQRQDDLYSRVARVGRLRKELPALRRGDYVPLTVTEDVLTFARTYQDQAAIVAINHAGGAQQVVVTVPSAMSGATSLIDRLDPDGRRLAVVGGHVVIDLTGRSAAVLVP